ncbi:SUR7/PalI family-domain-containing protein [Mycena floridula]|nr:SUR7/PalI family-domain-containing protein [Mycena floridula]
MGIIRPATPGFICTLVATILLAVVSFCVPYFKSVFFLKANISVNNVNGSITFGTLGYCLELSNGTSCSKPSVGYQLDINSLVGNSLPVEIPQVVVKWITYALVLHIVAMALAGASAVFGLLAHVREMSMACCSTCVSGFAAAIALLAFIFDLALFFLAKARINAVGVAVMGNAIWLTLAAWLLLFFSGCFYTLGRCCISDRGRSPRRSDWDRRKDGENAPDHNIYAEQMRLDAVKAEADRKANQKKEVGLPAFYETQPLKARIDGDNVYLENQYSDNAPVPSGAAAYGGRPAQGGGYSGGGYVQAPPGSRAVDEYYNPTQQNSYPPQPHRQASAHESNYAQSAYPAAMTTSPPLPNNNQYLSAQSPQAHPDRYGNASPAQYGHGHSAGTTYHSAASHQQYPTGYSQYDQDVYEPQQTQPAQYDVGPSNNGYQSQPYSNQTSYYSANTATPGPSQPERSYTLGGHGHDGYGANSVPQLVQHEGYFPQSSPGPINTAVGVVATRTSPVKGPRTSRTMSPTGYEESPPGYDAGAGNVQGAWGKH